MDSLGDFDQQLYFWATTGLGLGLVGLVNLVGSRLPALARVALSAAAAGLTFAALSSLDVRPVAYRAAAVLFAAAVAMVGLLRTRLPARAFELARRPAVAWGLLAAAGVGVMAAALVRHDRAFEAVVDEHMQEFNALSYVPERRWLDDVRLTTDRGYVIPVSVARQELTRHEIDDMERRANTLRTFEDSTIKVRPADVNSNCHGWVFAGGRFIVGGEQVETILQDNGYVAVQDPEPGDIVVYRDNGAVTHTAFVRYVGAGRPVLVEGKWGWMGVYLHAVEKSCYGTNFTFYRTARGGDLLRGLDSPATPVTAAAEPDVETVD